MRKEIVVARYNEPIVKWMDNIPDDVDMILYNKGDPVIDKVRDRASKIIKLPNTGREGHTYLTHIVDNYNDLADITFFTQGNPRPHLNGKKIADFFDIKDFGEPDAIHAKVATVSASKSMSGYRKGKPPEHILRATGSRWGSKKASITFPDWWKKYVRQELPDPKSVRFAWGGTFSVTKTYILRNSKRYYKKLLSTLKAGPNPEEGHYMERAWTYIFRPSEHYRDMMKKYE